MLQEVSGVSDYKFNPAGFIADEHHANWLGIKDAFGEAAIERAVSCVFHFKQCVHRQARKISDGDEFMRLTDQLVTAHTVHEFELTHASVLNFLKDHSDLEIWYDWWYARRTHFCAAFKPSNAPLANLAEVGHSKLASVGRRHMSLLEVAR